MTEFEADAKSKTTKDTKSHEGPDDEFLRDA